MIIRKTVMRRASIVAAAVLRHARPVMTIRKTVMRRASIVAEAVRHVRPVMIIRKTVMRRASIVAVMSVVAVVSEKGALMI